MALNWLSSSLSVRDKGKVNFKESKSAQPEETAKNEGGAIERPVPGNIYFFHPDHLGTATYLTDINGNPYQFFLNLPFGETMAEQHSQTEEYENPYKFNGKELDQETGLYYYGARYYDPRTSIWLGVDPLKEKYPNANPYNYCLQNPINLIDPDGMIPEDHKPPKKSTTFNESLNKGLLKGAQNRLNDYWSFAKKAVTNPKAAGWDIFEAAAKTVAGTISLVNDPAGTFNSTSDGITARATASENPVEGLGEVMGEIGTDVAAGELVGAGFARLGGLGVAAEELTVFRVFGEDAKMDGFSWTPVHPQSVDDFRGKAGLPSGGQSGKNNSATGMVKGTVQRRKIIEQRPARRLDGNMGRLDEYIINPKNVKNKKVSDN